MKNLGSSVPVIIPVGWEQYYSLPDFKKRWRRCEHRAK